MLTPPNSSSAKRNATKVCAIFEAGTIAVCRAGDLVALHIHTTDGEVLVRMAERDFIASCRGPRDHNGNPLRTFEQLDTDTRRHAEEQINARTREHEAQLGLSAETAARCELAWKLYVADTSLSQGRAAAQALVAAATFNIWARHHHGPEARQIRLQRWGSHHRQPSRQA